jgi:AraC family transcriptional regulator
MLYSVGPSIPVANAKPVRTPDYSIEIQRSGPAGLPAIYHNLHLIAIVLSGEPVVIRQEAGRRHAVRIPAGLASIHPAGPGTQVIWPDGIHCLYVHLHPRLIRRFVPGGTLHTRPRLRDPVIRGIGFELDRLVHTRPIDGRAVHELVIALAHHVAARYPAGAPPPVLVGSRELEQVLDVFRERVPSTYAVESVAEWCGLSRSHFSRRVRALTGLWPLAMVLGSRIEAAKHLLESGTTPLSGVAYASGFADQSHLTRALRCATGLTPADYRRGRSRSL